MLGVRDVCLDGLSLPAEAVEKHGVCDRAAHVNQVLLSDINAVTSIIGVTLRANRVRIQCGDGDMDQYRRRRPPK